MAPIRLTTKGEIASNTIDEWGNRIINTTITEYGVNVYLTPKIISNTVTVSDQTNLVDVDKSIVNVIGALDTFSRTFISTKVISNTISIVDVVNNSISRILSNTVSIGDVIDVARSRMLTEIISITGTLGSFSITKVIVSSLTGLVDVVSQSITKVNANSISMGDSVRNSLSRLLSDGISIVDDVINTKVKIIIDSLGLTDTMDPFNISKVIHNVTNVVDSRVSSVSKILNVDGISIGDVVNKAVSRTLVNDISILDTLSYFRTLYRTYVESIIATDTVSSIREFLYGKRSDITNRLLRSKIVNKLLRSKVDQYED